MADSSIPLVQMRPSVAPRLPPQSLAFNHPPEGINWIINSHYVPLGDQAQHGRGRPLQNASAPQFWSPWMQYHATHTTLRTKLSGNIYTHLFLNIQIHTTLDCGCD